MNRILFPQIQPILKLIEKEVQDKEVSLNLSPNNYLHKWTIEFCLYIIEGKPSALKGNHQHRLKYINMITTSGKEAGRSKTVAQAKQTHPRQLEV